MRTMPEKLAAMVQAGESEDEVQEIFDYLLNAEDKQLAFVNVYREDEQGFASFATGDEADQQLGKWRSMRSSVSSFREAFGLAYVGGNWIER